MVQIYLGTLIITRTENWTINKRRKINIGGWEVEGYRKAISGWVMKSRSKNRKLGSGRL
jgi:hypothetical protein